MWEDGGFIVPDHMAIHCQSQSSSPLATCFTIIVTCPSVILVSGLSWLSRFLVWFGGLQLDKARAPALVPKSVHIACDASQSR